MLFCLGARVWSTLGKLQPDEFNDKYGQILSDVSIQKAVAMQPMMKTFVHIST